MTEEYYHVYRILLFDLRDMLEYKVHVGEGLTDNEIRLMGVLDSIAGE
ncbi:hypothetical protein [Virgibacillus sp. SK37]|nr:hypothetical protein [Virgibacillus sp. SK37]AIF45419.1 hypothetical protein X953_10085 [Virgibacillus sp. SK37]